LDANVSHQQAIGILQQARGLVQLVVARPLTPSPQPTSQPSSDMVNLINNLYNICLCIIRNSCIETAKLPF